MLGKIIPKIKLADTFTFKSSCCVMTTVNPEEENHQLVRLPTTMLDDVLRFIEDHKTHDTKDIELI